MARIKPHIIDVGTVDLYKDVEVSLITSSRQRPEHLKRLLKSLGDNCTNPEMVEVLVKLDSDDDLHAYRSVLEGCPFKYKTLIYARMNGWHSMHHFYTDLAHISKGHSLWLLADDLVLHGGDWYSFIQRSRNVYKDHIYVLNVPVTPKKPGNNPFPVVSREWFKVLNCLSPYPKQDTWLTRMSKSCGRLVALPDPPGWNLVHNTVPTNLEGIKKTRLKDLDRHVVQMRPLFAAAIQSARAR